MKAGVLGLQGDVREHVRILESLGVTPVVVRRRDELDAVDALVLPGGESTTIGKLLHRFDLLEPLKERVDSGLPLFGTCAGLILMARDVVGHEEAPDRLAVMDVTVRRNAYGRQVDSFEADLQIRDLDEPLRAAFIRAPVVENAAAQVEVLAVWDDHPVLLRQGSMLGATFHPEVTGDARVHELFVRIAKAA